jgi:hypothetical protein
MPRLEVLRSGKLTSQMSGLVLGERVCGFVRPAAGVGLDPEEIKSLMEATGDLRNSKEMGRNTGQDGRCGA